MKSIFHRVLRRSPEKKTKKTQSTNEILLPVIGGKKTSQRNKFAFYWTILRLQGTLNASMIGSLEGGNVCSGSAATPVFTTLFTILQYVPVVLRFCQILKLFRTFF